MPCIPNALHNSFCDEHHKTLFESGAQAVLSITAGVPDYDNHLINRLSNTWLSLSYCDLETALDRAHQLVSRELLNFTPYCFSIPKTNVLFLGKTQNNLREFDFFCELLRRNSFELGVGANLSSPSIHRSRVQVPSAIIDTTVRWLYDTWAQQPLLTASCAYQSTEYAKAFLNFYVSFLYSANAQPDFAVVANDHIPAHVAFVRIATLFNVPTIYLQHAAVSPVFPPLATTISILRDKASFDIYNAIQESKSNVFIIGRNNSCFRPQGFAVTDQTLVPVVIYPSSRFNNNAMHSALKALQQNRNVSEIAIKPHPAASQKSFRSLQANFDIQIFKETPEFPHIGVCGNSSVALELLHRGVPVFHLFEIDFLPDDYYGFVAEGLVSAIKTCELGKVFWRRFAISGTWIARYSRYDPSVFGDSEDETACLVRKLTVLRGNTKPTRRKTLVDRTLSAGQALLHRQVLKIRSFVFHKAYVGYKFLKRVFIKLRKQLANTLSRCAKLVSVEPVTRSRNPQLSVVHRKRRQLLEIAIRCAASPTDIVQWVEQSKIVPLVELLQVIEKLWMDREPAALRILSSSEAADHNPDFRIWRKAMQIAWTGKVATAEEMLQIVSEWRHMPHKRERPLAMRLRASLFRALLNNAASEVLVWSRDVFEKMSVTEASLNQRVQLSSLLRALASNPPDEHCRLEASKWLSELDRKSDRVFELKLAASTDEVLAKTSRDIHASLEARYTAIVRGKARDELKETILPVYKRRRRQMVWADVRFDEALRSSMIKSICAKLQEKSPFALIRASEYEAYCFAGENCIFNFDDARWCERHWWGRVLDKYTRERVVGYVSSAFSDADILGVPSVMAFIRNFDYKMLSHFDAIQNRGLVQVLISTNAMISESIELTEDKVNRYLFRSAENLRSLVEASSGVIVVSGFRRERVERCFPSVDNLHVVEIPSHWRDRQLVDRNEVVQPLPFIFEQIAGDLKDLAQPGVLVLVAGGVIGKGFARDAKKSGAVAVDVGQDFEMHVLNSTDLSRRTTLCCGMAALA